MPHAPRKLLATADLHFRLHAQGDASTHKLARHVCGSDADVFVIAGDIADLGVENFEACLRLFDGFKGLKLLVPGNHDLWTTSADSMEKYRTVLLAVARRCGFHMLDTEPVCAGEVAFVGNIGWYDYSLRNPNLRLSDDDYRRKTLPGVCTWNDGVYIQWDLDDEQFSQMCLDRLERHYALVASRVERAVVVLHHLPFAEMIRDTGVLTLEFCRAYMGSARFGELLTQCQKVRHVICGHRHARSAHQAGRLEALAVGSEYTLKRLLALDLETGDSTYTAFPVEAAADD